MHMHIIDLSLLVLDTGVVRTVFFLSAGAALLLASSSIIEYKYATRDQITTGTVFPGVVCPPTRRTLWSCLKFLKDMPYKLQLCTVPGTRNHDHCRKTLHGFTVHSTVFRMEYDVRSMKYEG